MKILISAYACQPNQGREEGCGWNISYELAKLGHQIWVMTPLWNKPKIEEFLSDLQLPNLHFIYIEHPEWIIYFMRRFFHREISNYHYLIWQYKAYQIAKKIDKEQNFDLVHHLNIGSLVCGSWLWRLEKPFIFGPAGGGQIASPKFKKYYLGGWRTEGIRSFITKNLLPFIPALRKTMGKTNLLLAANSDTVNLAKKLGVQRAELFLDSHLPKLYSYKEPPLRTPAEELRLLWIGRLYPRKALLLALEALSQVRSSIPFKLTIVGSGPQDIYVHGWVQELALQGKVQHLSQISWEEVREKYITNDVLLFTSLRDSFGSQLLEAMNAALPIICLNHHGAKDFIPNNAGIKVSVDNPKQTVLELAEAITYMYHNPDKRLKMGQSGYEFASIQTWEYAAHKISNFYQEIIEYQRQSNPKLILNLSTYESR